MVIQSYGNLNEFCRYEKALQQSMKTGRLKYLYMGIGVGAMFLVTYASYAVAFWFVSVTIGFLLPTVEWNDGGKLE